MPHGQKPPEASSVVVGKILQSRQAWAALVETPSDGLLAIHGTTGNWMQLLERNTGECVHAAMGDASAVSSHSAAFDSKWRLTVTDSAGSNDRAEQELVRRRRDDWELLHLHCEVHKVATCFKQVFGLTPLATKGALHLALALRSGGGAYKLFRQHVRATIHSRLHFLRAPAVGEAPFGFCF